MVWEYKTLKIGTHGLSGGKVKADELDAALNEMGRKGWELVSLVATNAINGYTRDLLAIFKKRS